MFWKKILTNLSTTKGWIILRGLFMDMDGLFFNFFFN